MSDFRSCKACSKRLPVFPNFSRNGKTCVYCVRKAQREAMEKRKVARARSQQSKIDELRKRVRELEEHIEALTAGSEPVRPPADPGELLKDPFEDDLEDDREPWL